MKNAFNLLFWGVLLQYDVPIKGIDVLPDFIGFYLIYRGLSLIASESSFFEKGRKLSIPLIVLSLANFLLIIGLRLNNFASLERFLQIFSFYSIYELVFFGLSLYLFYNVVQGAKEIAKFQRKGHVYETTKQRWYAYFGVSVYLWVMSFISMIFPGAGTNESLQLLFGAGRFLYLFALIIFVSLMYYLKKELPEDNTAPKAKK